MDEALRVLERGAVVAAGTESFFGLMVDATRPDAIDRLLALKPRGADKGIPVIVPTRAAWYGLVTEVPPLAERLADRFWPGPLSIAVTAASTVDRRLALGGRIAVRLPGGCPAADLARAFGRPLTATSANPAGAAPTTTAAQVRSAFGRVEASELYVLEGTAPGGPASTVVVVSRSGYRVVRPGRIPLAQIAVAAGLDPGQRKR
jgi:L-threonylcarbamoyladenylate synthase